MLCGVPLIVFQGEKAIEPRLGTGGLSHGSHSNITRGVFMIPSTPALRVSKLIYYALNICKFMCELHEYNNSV